MSLVFLCIACFIAQFVDAIAGGGGIISLPAVIAYGVPLTMALGTNKMGAMLGCVSSASSFIKSGIVDLKIIKYWIPFSILGAILGVKTVLMIEPSILNVIITVLLISMCVYTLTKKEFGSVDNFKGRNNKVIIIGCIIAFTLGFYDGFFGPGAGSFLIFLLVRFIGFDFMKAAGYGKTLNAVSNVTAFTIFAISGAVDFKVGAIIAVFMITGSLLGTKMVLLKGSKLVKPVFIVVSLVLVCKIVLENI